MYRERLTKRQRLGCDRWVGGIKMKGDNMRKVCTTALSIIVCMGISAPAAAAWTASAVPTGIDIVRGEGFMIFGAFGNNTSCSLPDMVFVQADAPGYKEMLSAVFLAQSQNRPIMLWVHSCVPRTWYEVSSTTFNTVSVNAVIKLQ